MDRKMEDLIAEIDPSLFY